MAEHWYITLGILMLSGVILPECCGSNILVLPPALGMNSRLFNMQKMAIMLADHGHNVTLLINSRTREYITTKKVTVLEYSIPKDRKTMLLNDEKFQDIFLNKMFTGDVIDFFVHDFLFPYCISLLEHKDMIDSLKEQNFDLFLLDNVDHCGLILADYFNFPVLLYSNSGFSGDGNVFYPAPPSFVPNPDFGMNTKDTMTFFQRLTNFCLRIFQQVAMYDRMVSEFHGLRLKYGYGKVDSTKESYRHAILIATIDFALDYPRPLMPNIVPISGLFLVDPKPLNTTWTNFLDSAPKEGVILMAFGSIMSPFDQTKVEMVAELFSTLPHKVIWKHTGSKPEKLGSNTLLVDWLPQNDLLAHPNIKLFITHCGMSSTYETIKYAVPVVAMPIGFDQQRNAAFLTTRTNMGILLNVRTVNEQELRSAIAEVTGNETYLQNAKKTSDMIKDKPMPARELFLYWVDYVIRHKGAKHLASQAAHNLNFMQYHSLDVMLFLMVMALLALTIIVSVTCWLVRLLCRKAVGTGKFKQKSQ